MPPKKKQPVAEETDGRIVNMYERIPKELIDKVDNPNFHLHKLKIPFRMCVVAPSGSGKTNFVVNLIQLFSRGKGTFASIDIITRNKDEPLYRWLGQLSDQILIKEGLENAPRLDDFDKDENHLVIFDDLVLAKDQSRIENYYIRARKLNCSVIYLSQSYFKIPKIIRNNCSYLVLLKLSGHREVNMILSEGGLGVDKDTLLNIYQYATAEKFSPLVIDYEEEIHNRYRKGLLEIIDPSRFGNK
jgi:ABC-type dipeptide/oligopeptide/nickel transport system ATPase component